MSNKSPANLSPLFKEPSLQDQLIGLGVGLFMTVGLRAIGGGGVSSAEAFQGFGHAMFESQVTQLAMNVGVRQLRLSPSSAQVFGYAITGALTSQDLASAHADLRARGSSGVARVMSGNPWLNGALKGAMAGYGALMVDRALAKTSFYRKDPAIVQQLASTVGSFAGYAVYSGVLNASGVQIPVKVDGKVRYPSGGFAGGVDSAWLSARGHAIPVIIGDRLGDQAVVAKSIESMVGTAMKGHTGFRGAVLSGLAAQVPPLLLHTLTGDFNAKTGTNRWGLDKLQMAGVDFVVTAAVHGEMRQRVDALARD